MEAKDTVMNYIEKKLHGGYDPIVQAYVTGMDIISIQQNLCEAQAEISFKAGIKEVVEWMETFEQNQYYIFVKRGDLQTKLKEWGIND